MVLAGNERSGATMHRTWAISAIVASAALILGGSALLKNRPPLNELALVRTNAAGTRNLLAVEVDPAGISFEEYFRNTAGRLTRIDDALAQIDAADISDHDRQRLRQHLVGQQRLLRLQQAKTQSFIRVQTVADALPYAKSRAALARLDQRFAAERNVYLADLGDLAREIDRFRRGAGGAVETPIDANFLKAAHMAVEDDLADESAAGAPGE